MHRMYNPAHLGVMLHEYLGEMSVTEAVQKLGFTRSVLSCILNGTSGFSTEMALRLEIALETYAEGVPSIKASII